MNTSPKKLWKQASPPIKKGLLVLGVGFVATFVGISIWRSVQVHHLSDLKLAEHNRGVPVRTAVVERSESPQSLRLTGEARPFAEVTLYAKVSGYLKTVLVDKGDAVKKNQVLAVIESAETDQAYTAAAAEHRNKASISGRVQSLLGRGLVSSQEAETAAADAEVAQAKLQSAQTFKEYEKIRAPFDGVVTARFADPGALMQNAMSAQSGALPVVTVAQVNRVRVYVYVDQHTAQLVKVGAKAAISLTDDTVSMITAQVSRISGDLDTRTRMLLVEIDLENDKHSILVGSFVQVRLDLKASPTLRIPAEALVSRQGKSFAAVISDDQTLHYREIQVTVNDGETVSVISGLKPEEEVALNVGNSLIEGSKVWVQK